ncbi:hypothetical protein [Bradyrhizobium sp.]|uniref:hypothetical protein n=1 Tax=Bradyrhizobium sp. TaxID=376 RepID=UPI0040381A5F
MSERKDDRQLRLSFRVQHEARISKGGGDVRRDKPVTDLNSVRAVRHGASVLERVIREGYTKKK